MRDQFLNEEREKKRKEKRKKKKCILILQIMSVIAELMQLCILVAKRIEFKLF